MKKINTNTAKTNKSSTGKPFSRSIKWNKENEKMKIKKIKKEETPNKQYNIDIGRHNDVKIVDDSSYI